jgi:glyoxylase I family protein
MIRFEHVAFNVPDVHAAVQWYCDNLGFVVVRQQKEPPYMSFIADADKNMMFEFYTRDDVPKFDPSGLHDVTTHVALVTDDIEGVRTKLIAAGAKASGEIALTSAGDKLAFLRDPHGVVLQLCQRAVRMV